MPGHSSITVTDLLRLALPVGTTIVAGHRGIHRPVEWVSVLNTRPPAFPDLVGGEIALLSLDAMHLLSDKLTLPTLVRDLSEMDVSAIGVVGEIGAQAHAMAEEAGIPLLHLPETTLLRNVERQIAQTLMGSPASPEERGQEVREQLLQLSTENRGLAALTSALADVVGKTVVVQDKRLHPLSVAGPLAHTPAWTAIEDALYDANPLPALFRDRMEVAQASPDPVAIPLPVPGLRRLVAPIVAGKMGRGFLSLLFDESQNYDALDVTLARHGAAVCALEMAKEKAIREAQKRVQGNVLEQFLGGIISENEALLRLTRLGYQPEQEYTTLYIGGLRENIPSARQIEALCNEQASALGFGALVQPYGSEVIVFVEGEESVARDLAFAVQGRVSERYHADIAVGMGQPSSELRAWRESFQQAVAAYRTAQQWRLTAPLAFWEMGVYRLLSLLAGSPELRKFYYETLGELAEDTAHNQEFIITLEAFFEEHGNLTRTAKRLHVHRNTLLYRMERIKEISGLDLDNPETRLAVHLALRIRRIL
ncbi:MAG TPA: helix-turn-helix domain-containing protein [Aggregatilinea sp.]|uniref:PucR family transcriptional regulator n=1 Tax=Aggregatilinea sp. TaxID=2806333 RepID=UPI002CF3444B|nr:helix-turn-helix domain-containing protein [Aggregatilinea sp.]HML22315.1 helix-turn-helix domain-containing protein [Aggregatilinea sp.]